MPPAKDSNQFVNGSRSTPCNKLDTVKKHTRILSYEKTIVGHALTQIDHAQTAGQIGEHAHSQLLTKYSNRMTQLEQQLSNNQQIIQLDELTATRNSLTQLFNEKMGHISSGIAEIQSFLNPIPFESRRQVPSNQSPATSLPTRHWGSMNKTLRNLKNQLKISQTNESQAQPGLQPVSISVFISIPQRLEKLQALIGVSSTQTTKHNKLFTFNT
jgi:seryl-tRNA synthetase